MKNSRIDVLDGYRALAILAVIFYHYFTRWTPPLYNHSLYPYDGQYNYFGLGYLGVQFFFMISGFVIFFTMEQTPSLSIFWKKRFIRLFPSMLVASLITIIVFFLADPFFLFPDAHEIKNLLPGLIFSTPSLLNKFSWTNFEYLNPSYWSLWPEVQFYFLIGIIYYVNKVNAVRNFILLAFLLMFINALFSNINLREQLEINDDLLTVYFVWIANIFTLIIFLPHFCAGILFYILYKEKERGSSWFIKLSMTFVLVFMLYNSSTLFVALIYLAMFLLFFGFIYWPKTVRLFENNMIVRTGKSSYFLYLIHESIGVLLIFSFAGYFIPLAFVMVMLLISLFVFASIFYTEKIDKRLTSLLRKFLLPAANSK